MGERTALSDGGDVFTAFYGEDALEDIAGFSDVVASR